MSELEVVEQVTDSDDDESDGDSLTDDDEPTEEGKSISEEHLVDQVLEQVGSFVQDDDDEEEEEERVYAVEPVQVIEPTIIIDPIWVHLFLNLQSCFIAYNAECYSSLIRLETKSCRILPLTYGTKYDMT